ncbi:hypothetical protein [Rhizobium herbae]|uniref:Uncharacterized protein n=1 Tax=Rhizobium herbae TaxID=508661 RepID=A0ABS4EP74_9HYPH|nr:hypothetical protein [Rhizobium herbae]MBP1859752.1 hypothetical protein [Rhizobium herbae]
MNEEIKQSDGRALLIYFLEFLSASDKTLETYRYDENGVRAEFIDYDLVVKFLFGILAIENIEACVGKIITKNEAPKLENLATSLRATLEEDYPDELTADYVRTPRWQSVVRNANILLEAVRKGDV